MFSSIHVAKLGKSWKFEIGKEEVFVFLHPMRSPVALFVYNRLDNTRQTLERLLANTQARETDVYVFSDGGRDETSWRQVNELRSWFRKKKREVEESGALRSLTLTERPENIYLERNIMEGVAQVLSEHETIIVLEDDICTSRYYLEYMNEAFDLYRNIPKVMHVSGFTNLDMPVDAAHPEQNFYFTPHMSGWGWGTWRDRWNQYFHHFQSREEALQGMTESDQKEMEYGGVFPCLKGLDRNPIPWDICWEIAIYKAGGLCLTPAHTMIRNIGLKNGTHFRSMDILQWYEYDREPLDEPLRLVRVDNPQSNPQTEALFREAIRDWGIRYTMLGKVVRMVYKNILQPLMEKRGMK